MAVAQIDIWNLALQLLGAKRVAALDEDSRSARSCGACYAVLRDREMARYPWIFAITRTVLAPDVTAPAFDYNYQFTLPADFLRALLPSRTTTDWLLESGKLLTNDGSSINFRYIARVEDVSRYDPNYCYGLAAAMAAHMCEEVTQSNSKKADAQAAYKEAIAEARRVNAMEKVSLEPPEDPWLAARYSGYDGQAPWLRGG